MTPSPTWICPDDLADQAASLYSLDCPPRWGMPRNPDRPTLGGKAAKVMAALGFTVMPWQRYVLDVALELDPDTGLLAYREVGLSIPRQNGKTTLILGTMVHRLMAWERSRVIYAAQNRSEAYRRFDEEFCEVLAGGRLSDRYRVRRTTGSEQVIWGNASRLGITSNTEKAAHGAVLDLGIIDEAFAHQDDRLEQAFIPAMATRANGQLWWASAGGTERSFYLNRKRQTGRDLVERLWNEGTQPRTAYFEWFSPEDEPRDDPATWRGCLPALGHTITEETIRADLERMEPSEFDRAYLNRTRKSVPPPDTNVPVAEWPQCHIAESVPGDELAFALDVSPGRDWASIACASLRPDGIVHVELIARRPGTDWVVPALVKLAARWSPVAVALDIPSRSPVGALLADLHDAGIRAPADADKPSRGDLAVPRTADVTAACAQFADAVRQGRIAHIDQGPLTAALNGARTRPVGDSWAWHRRSASVDISPLVAVTLARWALLTRLPIISDGGYSVLDSVA